MTQTRTTAKTLDLSGMYPDLFADLTADQAHRVEKSFAADWHEGWQPNREDVARFSGYIKGEISEREYLEAVGLRHLSRH